MEGGKASAGQQGRRGKKALGCRTEGEIKTQTQGAGQNDRERKGTESRTALGGTVGERYEERKKYRGREKGEKGQLAVQGDRKRKDGRANGAERERQKKP